MALRAIRSKKIRAFLTMLGLIIGVASIVVIVSLGEGNKKQIQDEIKKMGNDLVMVNIQGQSYLPQEAYAQICKAIPEIKNGTPLVQEALGVQFTSAYDQVNIVGIHPNFFKLTSQELLDGRLLNAYDFLRRQNVCVIERTAASQKMFGLNPRVGSVIRIQNQPFTVVGVIKHKDSQFVYAQNSIYVCSTTYRFLKPQPGFKQSLFAATDINLIPRMSKQIRTLIINNFHLNPDEVTVQSLSEFLKSAQQIVAKVTAVIGGIAGISLLVGGIGIMNIMLVSVTERTREIGILKAIGASQRAILFQFLIETIIISTMGGLIGIFLGLGIASFVAKATGLPSQIPVIPSLIGFTFSVLTGILSGFYPAYKAARLNPVDALRAT